MGRRRGGQTRQRKTSPFEKYLPAHREPTEAEWLRQQIDDEFWFRLLAHMRGQPTTPWDDHFGPWDAEDDEILESMLADNEAGLNGKASEMTLKRESAKPDDPIFREPWTVSGVWKPPAAAAPDGAAVANQRTIANAIGALLKESEDPHKRGALGGQRLRRAAARRRGCR